MKKSTEIAMLVIRQLQDEELAPQERERLEHWLAESAIHRKHYEELKKTGLTQEYKKMVVIQQQNYAAIMDRFNAKRKKEEGGGSVLRILLMVAAAIIVIFGMVAINGDIFNLRSDKVVHSVVDPAGEIKPATTQALLTLADGSTIALDSNSSGVLAVKGGVRIKAQRGKLIEYSDEEVAGAAPATHTLITPNGGVFQVSLSDGTKVWLNAGSKLVYPTIFEKNRQVQLEGEAYFEVAHQEGHPFTVEAMPAKGEAPTRIDVLGTHFNVKAYPNTPDVKTTLLQGAVRVRHGAGNRVLKPGQQATVKKTDRDGIQVKQVPVRDAVAWKEGIFTFENMRADEILAEIARWYDLSVVWEGKVPASGLMLIVSRRAGIDETLRLLEGTGVGLEFSRTGREVTVRESKDSTE